MVPEEIYWVHKILETQSTRCTLIIFYIQRTLVLISPDILNRVKKSTKSAGKTNLMNQSSVWTSSRLLIIILVKIRSLIKYHPPFSTHGQQHWRLKESLSVRYSHLASCSGLVSNDCQWSDSVGVILNRVVKYSQCGRGPSFIRTSDNLYKTNENQDRPTEKLSKKQHFDNQTWLSCMILLLLKCIICIRLQHF